MRRVHVVVSGLVQGVGFRYYALQQAERLGIAGWVRNRSDGSVEAELEGTPEAVAAMLDWASEGPASARVRNLRTTDIPPLGGSGFNVRG